MPKFNVPKTSISTFYRLLFSSAVGPCVLRPVAIAALQGAWVGHAQMDRCFRDVQRLRNISRMVINQWMRTPRAQHHIAGRLDRDHFHDLVKRRFDEQERQDPVGAAWGQRAVPEARHEDGSSTADRILSLLLIKSLLDQVLVPGLGTGRGRGPSAGVLQCRAGPCATASTDRRPSG